MNEGSKKARVYSAERRGRREREASGARVSPTFVPRIRLNPFETLFTPSHTYATML